MKIFLCILALFVLTASSADAYVRRTVGGGYVARGVGYRGYYHGRARGVAPVVGAGVAVGAAAAGATTDWGWGQQGSAYYPYQYGRRCSCY